MTDLASVWFLLGTLGMAAGTAPSLWRLATDRRHRAHYAVLAAVTGVAALAYLTMALGFGTISVGDATLLAPRYVDWSVTTPLLVGFLGMLCRPARRVYVALAAVDASFIGSGVLAGLLPEPYNYVAYLASGASYLALLVLLVAVLPRRAALHGDRVYAVFTKLRNLTVVLWTLYPVVWVLGPLGTGLLQSSTEIMVVTYLDLISKVGFVAMAVNGADALDQLRTGATPSNAADAATAD